MFLTLADKYFMNLSLHEYISLNNLFLFAEICESSYADFTKISGDNDK